MSTAEELAKHAASIGDLFDDQIEELGIDIATELRRLAEIERQYLALKTSIVEPVAWGLFAQVEDGVFYLQHPVWFTEDEAKADRTTYDRTTQIRIHPLYAIKENSHEYAQTTPHGT